MVLTLYGLVENSTGRRPVPIEPNHLLGFYRPIILEKAFIKACRDQDFPFEASSLANQDSLLSSEQAFHSFVNKLAQVCDIRRGGDTVTAFTVLRGDDGPHYIFGSNQRCEEELIETKTFVESLLKLASRGVLEPGRPPVEGRPRLKKVLWHILFFNLPRLEVYLNNLSNHLNGCMALCQSPEFQSSKSLIRLA